MNRPWITNRKSKISEEN